MYVVWQAEIGAYLCTNGHHVSEPLSLLADV